MSSLIHPYFFLINTDAQNEILSGLDLTSQGKLLELGVSLLGLDKDIVARANINGDISEVLGHISGLCSSQQVLSSKIIQSALSDDEFHSHPSPDKARGRPASKRHSAVNKEKSPVTARKSITPNQEQETIVNNCHRGIQVNAFAGSGKSTVSRFIVDELGDDATIYTAFLSENANDARAKITRNAQTQDALALSVALKVSPFVNSFTFERKTTPVYEVKNITGFDLMLDTGAKKIKQHLVAKLIHDTIQTYCHSCDDVMTDIHVPSQVMLPESRRKILCWASSYWDFLLSGRAGEEHPTTFHHVMKFWSLSPDITIDDRYRNIIVDEAQDINGAFLSVINNHNDRNVIIIGDAYQQLFKWRGAINSMGRFAKDIYPLSHSYRFGEAIAKCSNNVLAKHSSPPEHRLLGQRDMQSEVFFYDDEHELPDCPGAILARTRGQVIAIADDELRMGHKVHIKTETGSLKFVLINLIYLAKGDVDKVTHPYLSRFSHFAFFVSELEDSHDPDLYFALKLYEKYGDDVINIINRIEKNNTPEEEATKVISTTHSIKGHEWDQIVIASDYAYILDKPGTDMDSELSVLYVALTRARYQVYIPAKLRPYFS